MPLAEIVERPDIQELFKPLYERHLKSLNIIRDRASESGGVITFDLTGYDLEGYNKFIPYYLYPGEHLHGVGEPVEFPHEDFGGIESVGARRAAA